VAYLYDVFISYPHSSAKIRAWVAEVFEPRLRWELGTLSRHRDRVFLDTASIREGNWTTKLTDAHLRAALFVPVLSPVYFESDWCTGEWTAAMAREAATGRTLVVPVVFNDCDDSTLDRLAEPVRAQVRARLATGALESPDSKQCWDYRATSNVLRHDQDSPKAELLRDRMLDLVTTRVAPLLDQAPPWSDTFPPLRHPPAAATASPFGTSMHGGA
jgi:hypothetical protein